jgi:hypothetical protein
MSGTTASDQIFSFQTKLFLTVESLRREFSNLAAIQRVAPSSYTNPCDQGFRVRRVLESVLTTVSEPLLI